MNKELEKIVLLISILLLFSGKAFAATEKPVHVYLSAAGGFDDNPNLDSFRREDFFTQESASVLYKRLLHTKAQLRLSYSVFNVNYFEATDENILLNQASGGISLLLTPTTVWENDYTFQYLDFTRNIEAVSYSNEIRSGIRQRIGNRMIFKAGFSFLDRQYEDKKARMASGSLSLDDERSDLRYSIDALFQYKLNSSVILNAGSVISWNDSDDLYQDYYDYLSAKFFTGFSWQWSPKWNSFFKFTYEKRDYDSRLTLVSSDKEQSDDLYTAYASLYYKINANLSAGSTYTYRQKNSNEPSQVYSGALGTLGLYYSF